MLGHSGLSRTASFRPENLRRNALHMIGNLCFTISEWHSGDSISVGSASGFGKMRRNLLYQGHDIWYGNSVGKETFKDLPNGNDCKLLLQYCNQLIPNI
ncbi:hypothetical protein V6N13_131720 [Hibiscus sabdariffa]